MKSEKIILAFLAILIGLIVSAGAFFLYQSTKTISPSSVKTITLKQPTPTPGQSIPLLISSPQDESVVSNKILPISGQTDPKAVVVVTTDAADTVVTPSSTGSFSLTVTLPASENQIIITAIAPNGSETQKKLTVGYTTEDF